MLTFPVLFFVYSDMFFILLPLLFALAILAILGRGAAALVEFVVGLLVFRVKVVFLGEVAFRGGVASTLAGLLRYWGRRRAFVRMRASRKNRCAWANFGELWNGKARLNLMCPDAKKNKDAEQNKKGGPLLDRPLHFYRRSASQKLT